MARNDTSWAETEVGMAKKSVKAGTRGDYPQRGWGRGWVWSPRGRRDVPV